MYIYTFGARLERQGLGSYHLVIVVNVVSSWEGDISRSADSMSDLTEPNSIRSRRFVTCMTCGTFIVTT